MEKNPGNLRLPPLETTPQKMTDKDQEKTPLASVAPAASGPALTAAGTQAQKRTPRQFLCVHTFSNGALYYNS